MNHIPGFSPVEIEDARAVDYKSTEPLSRIIGMAAVACRMQGVSINIIANAGETYLPKQFVDGAVEPIEVPRGSARVHITGRMDKTEFYSQVSKLEPHLNTEDIERPGLDQILKNMRDQRDSITDESFV